MRRADRLVQALESVSSTGQAEAAYSAVAAFGVLAGHISDDDLVDQPATRSRLARAKGEALLHTLRLVAEAPVAAAAGDAARAFGVLAGHISDDDLVDQPATRSRLARAKGEALLHTLRLVAEAPVAAAAGDAARAFGVLAGHISDDDLEHQSVTRSRLERLRDDAHKRLTLLLLDDPSAHVALEKAMTQIANPRVPTGEREGNHP